MITKDLHCTNVGMKAGKDNLASTPIHQHWLHDSVYIKIELKGMIQFVGSILYVHKLNLK